MNGVFDVVELHELAEGDVVLTEVLVDLMLGDPLAMDGVDGEHRLDPLLLMECEEFGVGLDDCHPRAASGGERAVDGGEILKKFGLESDDFGFRRIRFRKLRQLRVGEALDELLRCGDGWGGGGGHVVLKGLTRLPMY